MDMISNLAPVTPGCVRVFRVERKTIVGTPGKRNRHGVDAARHTGAIRLWSDNNTPWGDGIDNFRPGKHVCGALEHQLDNWWPPECLELLMDTEWHLVALDVPNEYVLKGYAQVVFERSQIMAISVLIQ